MWAKRPAENAYPVRSSLAVFGSLLLALGLSPAPASPDDDNDWPEITGEERALTELAWRPNAPAVILRREGRLNLTRFVAATTTRQTYSASTTPGTSSFQEVFTRIKILTPEGTKFGSISVPSTPVWRLRDLDARTVLPDGSVVPLEGETTFKKSYSAEFGGDLISFVMPDVEPGAIIDYRYRHYFDSLFFPEPWFFESELPTQSSRFVCDIPQIYQYDTDFRCSSGIAVGQEKRGYVAGTLLTYTAEQVAPVPNEPASVPFADLACQVTLLPTSFRLPRRRRIVASWFPVNVLDSWRNVINHFVGDRDNGYGHLRSDIGTTNRQARRIGAGLKGQRERAEAVYRWVRDEITTRGPPGIGTGVRRADGLIKRREASRSEKALLLQLMLKALKIPSSAGLTRNRYAGQIVTEVPNPAQFDSILVVAEIDDSRVFLFPADRRLAFGALPPALEGVACLLIDERHEVWVTTPLSPPSQQNVFLELTLDEAGVLSGTGAMTLTGHHAFNVLLRRPTRQATLAGWIGWIEDNLPGFSVQAIGVTEEVEKRLVQVGWEIKAREETVLSDEASIGVAAPFAVTRNQFTQAPEQRQTPLLLAFSETQNLNLTLTWPPGWVVDYRPRLRSVETAIGSLKTALSIDEQERSLTLKRVFTRDSNELTIQEYGALHQLYREIVANDAEEIILIRQPD